MLIIVYYAAPVRYPTNLIIEISSSYLVTWRFFRIRYLLPFSTLVRRKDGPLLASVLVVRDLAWICVNIQYSVCRRRDDMNV